MLFPDGGGGWSGPFRAATGVRTLDLRGASPSGSTRAAPVNKAPPLLMLLPWPDSPASLSLLLLLPAADELVPPLVVIVVVVVVVAGAGLLLAGVGAGLFVLLVMLCLPGVLGDGLLLLEDDGVEAGAGLLGRDFLVVVVVVDVCAGVFFVSTFCDNCSSISSTCLLSNST